VREQKRSSLVYIKERERTATAYKYKYIYHYQCVLSTEKEECVYVC
jgi:hypothetical protein